MCTCHMCTCQAAYAPHLAEIDEEAEQAAADGAGRKEVGEYASGAAAGAAAGESGLHVLSDDELRRRREEAQATLKRQRSRTLSDTLSTAAIDAALAAAQTATGGEGGRGGNPLASWAAEKREHLRKDAEAADKVKKPPPPPPTPPPPLRVWPRPHYLLACALSEPPR